MLLPLSTGLVTRLIQLPSVESTNAELARLALESELPPFTTVVTDDQTAGRGRRDRVWTAPAGTSLAISVLVRPRGPDGAVLDAARLGWLPIASGVAMTDAVRDVLPAASIGFKWPNDVQVAGRKICGVLAELLPAGTGVVVGAGVNLWMSADELPVPTATSALLEGATGGDLADRVLAAYLTSLVELVETYGDHNGDAESSGLRAAAVERCTTLGRQVRAELPGGAELVGEAIGIDLVGRLQIRLASGRVEAIAAGDIIHLR